MGLLDLLRKLKKNDKEAKILVLGLDNAGKTTLLKFLSSEAPSTMEEPTKGFNVKTIVKDGFKLNVWDIGGQAAIRAYWENYYDRTDGLVFVVDSSDDYRLKETTSIFQILLNEPKLAKVPILVFANKQDKNDALQPNEIMEQMNLGAITGRKWSINACVATEGTGVVEGMKWLVETVSKNTNSNA